MCLSVATEEEEVVHQVAVSVNITVTLLPGIYTRWHLCTLYTAAVVLKDSDEETYILLKMTRHHTGSLCTGF